MTNSPELFGYPAVDLPPSATESPEAAIKYLVDQLAQSGRLRPADAGRVCGELLHRESLGSTAIGGGLALPHSKSDAVSDVSGVVGRAAEPIRWPRGPGEEAVRLVCLLVTPTSDPGTFLRAMEDLSRRVRGG